LSVAAFLGAGWKVVAGVRDLDAARGALGADERLLIVRMDVRNDDEVSRGVRQAEEFAGGALASVVANAGHAALGAHEEADLGVARDMFDTNLFGAARVTQAALPAMREAGRGSVIFISSIGARMPIPMIGFYQGTKAAMGMMAECLAVEMRPFGVRVAIIEPGAVTTEFGKSTVPMGAAVAGKGPYAPLMAEVRRAVPALRTRFPLSAEAVAQVALAAASKADWPFRTVMGEDSAATDEMRDHAESDEVFQKHLLEFLGVEWPKVPPPA
jgi:NAD(P)-dependent dehydrogenase (short-subunit alcohol dehydrogenase family)